MLPNITYIITKLNSFYVLKSTTSVIKMYDRFFVLQSGESGIQIRTGIRKWTIFVTKWERYYKVVQILLQSGTGITKWSNYYVPREQWREMGESNRFLSLTPWFLFDLPVFSFWFIIPIPYFFWDVYFFFWFTCLIQ